MQDAQVRAAVKQALVENTQKGSDYRSFKQVVDASFDKAGLTKAKPHQIQNIYATNTALAFSSGQMNKLSANAERFPYWRYSAIRDSKTRAQHNNLHGKIFKNGDWEFYPPLGFRCRCVAIPLTARRVQPNHTSADKKRLAKQLNHAQFLGNKNKEYMKWLAKKYHKVDAPAKKLLDQEIESLAKKERTPNALESKSFKRYKKELSVEIDKEFEKLVPEKVKFQTSNRGLPKGLPPSAFYLPSQDVIKIPLDYRRKRSKWYSEAVIYHEFGHRIDWEHNLRKSKEVKKIMDKHRKILSKHNNLGYKEMHQQYITEAHRIRTENQTNYDQAEQLGGFSDTLMSLNKNYGKGHPDWYWDKEGNPEAEFIAHMYENAYSGNPLFKRLAPDLYKDMVKLEKS